MCACNTPGPADLVGTIHFTEDHGAAAQLHCQILYCYRVNSGKISSDLPAVLWQPVLPTSCCCLPKSGHSWVCASVHMLTSHFSLHWTCPCPTTSSPPSPFPLNPDLFPSLPQPPDLLLKPAFSFHHHHHQLSHASPNPSGHPSYVNQNPNPTPDPCAGQPSSSCFRHTSLHLTLTASQGQSCPAGRRAALQPASASETPEGV